VSTYLGPCEAVAGFLGGVEPGHADGEDVFEDLGGQDSDGRELVHL
jgi:hypothetical protein